MLKDTVHENGYNAVADNGITIRLV